MTFTIINTQLLNTLLKEVFINQPPITRPLHTPKLTRGEERYARNITRLLEDQTTLTSDYIGGMEKHLLERADFMDRLTPQLDNLLYNTQPTLDKYIEDIYRAGKETGFDRMKAASFFGESDKHALYSLRNYNFGQVRGLTVDLQSSIRETVWQGILRGESPGEIAEGLLSRGLPGLKTSNGRTITPETRAELIARTETMRANNQGALLSYKQYGVELVDWIFSDDEVGCDDCASMAEDSPYPVDDVPEGGPPLHPNCRCNLAPHMPSLEEPVDPDSYLNLVTGEEEYVTIT